MRWNSQLQRSSVPEDVRNYRPKHVELIVIINKIIIVASSWLFILLMETEFVLCEVRTVVWSLTYQHNMDNLRSGHSIVQRVIRRLLITEAWIRSRVSQWDFRWTKWHWDRFSSECSSFPLPISFQTRPVLTFIYTVLVPEQMDESWELSKKSNAASEIGSIEYKSTVNFQKDTTFRNGFNVFHS